MFVKLLLLFTLLPVTELFILIKAGGAIGTLNTVAIVIVTGVIGASFARSQGAQIITKIKTQLSQGQLPGEDLLEGAMILAGGILLVTPGFITDLVGLSLLFPPTRKLYANLTFNYFKKKFESGQWKYSVQEDVSMNVNLSFGTPDRRTSENSGEDESSPPEHEENDALK